MSDPSISVVVPMFNAAATIGDCLDSLLTQSFAGWEAVVVDDGSTDDGPAIVSGFAARDRRVRMIRQPNRGLPEARNSGINAAGGDWVRLLDADDWLLIGSHEALLRTASDAGAPMVAGGVRYHDEHGADLGWSFRPGVATATLEMLVEFHRFQVSAAMVRRDLLLAFPFRSAATGSEDLDVWLRLCESGRTWACTDTDVAAYRLRRAGMSRDHVAMARVATEVVSGCFERCPALESERPGGRARCLKRIALERSSSLALERGTVAGVGLWRSLAGTEIVTPREAASAAHWSVPYSDCMPPTAWQRDDLAERYLGALIGLWAHLGLDACATLRELAVVLARPDRVAARIADSIEGDRPVMLHGLGRNAAELAPVLSSRGMRLLGSDRSATPGSIVAVGGVPVRVTGAAAAPPGATHVLTAWDAPGLEASIPERCLKWRQTATDISDEEFRRLLALTRLTAVLPLGGVAA